MNVYEWARRSTIIETNGVRIIICKKVSCMSKENGIRRQPNPI